MPVDDTICDFCSTEIPMRESNACARDCGGTFCNEHASPDAHDCKEPGGGDDGDSNDEAPDAQ